MTTTCTEPADKPGPWFVYLLHCSDQTLYTGITTDLQRRLQEHNGGRAGARYTRARRPVRLVYFESATDRSMASRREYAVRRLSSRGKRQLAYQAQLRCREQARQLALCDHYIPLP